MSMALRASTYIAMAGALAGLQARAAATKQPAAVLRALVPSMGSQETADRYLTLLEMTSEYNRAHPGAPVDLVRQGTDFSSMRELIASHLAGSLPDLALVEPSELPAM